MGLDEEQTSVVAKYTGRVLMGLLPFKEFPITLELELNVDEQTANKLAREINLAILKMSEFLWIKFTKKRKDTSPMMQILKKMI